MFDTSLDFRRQALNIFPACLGQYLFGNAFGWVAPALAYYESKECPFLVTESELSWMASAYFLAEIISPVVVGVFANKAGRKTFLILGSFLHALSWLMMILATNATTILASRFIMGAAAGVHDQAWSVYVGEVTTPNKRGIFSSIMLAAFCGGIMIEFLLSSFVHYQILLIVPFALSAMNLIFFFFIVESPTFLIMKGKDRSALKTLAWLQGKSEQAVKGEFEKTKGYLHGQMNQIRNRMQIFNSSFELRLFAVVILVFVFAQPSGNIIILSYETIVLDLFDNLPDRNSLTLIYGVVQFLGINISTFLIERVERKVLLNIGFGVSAVLQTALAALFYIAEHGSYRLPYIPQIIFVLLNLYGAVFIIFIFPTVYVLKSELLPQRLKTIGSVSATLTNALAEFAVVKPFMFIWDEYGLYANFALCSVTCVVACILMSLLVPKTRGKSLIEIQQKKKKNAGDTTANTVSSISECGAEVS